MRTSDLLVSRLNWRRGHFEAFSGAGTGAYAEPSVLERVVVPDLSAVTWLPFALPAALRLAREERFDCVLTSSPPPSAHLVGLALKRRGLCWIADFRDGWTFEPGHAPWFVGPQGWADASLERRVAQRADAAVAVSQPIADDLRERFGLRTELITNGFDPDDVPGPDADGLLDPERHSLVHTGRMAAAGRSPKALLEALRAAPALGEKLEVVFAGPLSEDERGLLDSPDLTGIVRPVGSLDRAKTLALQRAADSLLVVTGGARRSEATGKLYEYLAARRPVLVLGDDTEAARIVAETEAGFATSADDPEAIAGALQRLVESPPEVGASADEYSYPELARRLGALIEDVCA